ncbi:NUDIX hydrolase [Gordonia sp. (in: high G+C Gram-positive bacteria)]|uniref:NUDIX hydrolase n=1 Tax=Gordonia sp. (in: high G+C Gram-positive bacteria) TaxID=84139 RepID=UPI0016A6E445|nr:NUDIX hydrolase [Gordonia sp. (in: high G+C Gram-positive bacteria)]NLG47625.1 NUDIX hydrolase [Gordonia sp. (in: high G+C Gram-positive bacteria)]
MSAEPSLQRPDVKSDAPAVDAASGGGSGKGGSAPKSSANQQGAGSGQSSRSRRNRRGRRRRGRLSGSGPGQQESLESTVGDSPAAAESAPSTSKNATPTNATKKRNGSPRNGGSKHTGKGGGPRNSGHKSSGAKNNGAKNTPKNGPAKAVDGDVAAATKPSDLAADVRLGTANSPASMPRTRRRTARHPDAENPPRLHTVRETSAGGLVLSDLDAPFGELSAALIGRIDRRGRMMWSLPKGHIETGETAEQTAMREVAEETGIEGTIVAPLGKIDYWFVSEGKRIHKTVHHYLLRFTGGELSDADYEVSAVAWVPLTELPRRLTYSDERRLARMAESVIADLQGDPHRLAQSEASCLRTEPNDYEKAAAARNQRRNEPPPAPKPRRRRRRPRRTASGDS